VPPIDPAVREFHRGLAGYAVTPLVECRRAAAAAGVGAVWVKDESSRFGLNAFKALGASWAMSRVAAPVYATATDGNHGRAVAWMARRKGAAARVFVPRNTPAARIGLIEREGADVRVVAGTYDDAVRVCAEESAAHGWQVMADTGYAGYTEIPEWIVEGYGTLFAEYAEQAPEKPDVVFVQGGVGGLLCAAVRHFRGRAEHGSVKMVAVEPLDADCLLESIRSEDGSPRTAKGTQNSIMQGLNCGEVSRAAWSTVRSGVDLFVAIEDEFATEAVELLAPMASGESGAAGLAGLIAVSRNEELRAQLGIGAATRVLVINTEGHAT
jgi:diaminopropionate ammonia-lyase